MGLCRETGGAPLLESRDVAICSPFGGCGYRQNNRVANTILENLTTLKVKFQEVYML